jgi:TonB family protein
MATDIARVQLELASGRNEITAPFHETAQRRRKQPALDASLVDVPAEPQAPTQIVVAVPLATEGQLDQAPAFSRELAVSQPPTAARPPWIAFGLALVAVAVGMWWVMSQRMPDIDPREVIARNLNDAEAAMADGRYTDPPERSAFHYYNTVLALDPANADALTGIDAIADRHLTNARVLLAGQNIAEAGVALEKARRVRPEHEGLAALDAQWRGELRKIIAASTVVAKPMTEPAPKSTVTKLRDAIQRTIGVEAPQAEKRTVAVVPKIEDSPPPPAAASAPEVKPLDLMAALSAPEPVALIADAPDTGANIVDESPAAAMPIASTAATEPKLVRMVQPVYPQEALMRGLEGWVDVSLQVSPAGDVIAPRVEESSRGRMFNRAALNAVQQWKYEPRSDSANSERVRVRLKFEQSN